MSTKDYGTQKVWRVYLPNGSEIQVICDWVETDDLGEIVRFMNNWPKDVAYAVGVFYTNNICGYLQVGVVP